METVQDLTSFKELEKLKNIPYHVLRLEQAVEYKAEVHLLDKTAIHEQNTALLSDVSGTGVDQATIKP